MIRILLYLAIVIQLIAMYFAIRMVRVTKYNSIWILFFVGFTVLAVQRVLQLWMNYGHPMPVITMVWFDIAVSFCISVGMVFLHRLFVYIDRLNRHRQLTDKRILTAVLRTEEKSRANFSKELHDGLGPLLSSVRMSVSALLQQPLDATQKEILTNTEYVVNEAVKSLTEISNNLSPHILDNFGVARAIHTFVHKLQPMCPATRIVLRTKGMRDLRFERDREVILYRVVSELINNALKHAGAANLTIDMQADGDRISVRVADDGCGFDPETEPTGMGLSNIASRISSIHGELTLDSRPGGGGTRV